MKNNIEKNIWTNNLDKNFEIMVQSTFQADFELFSNSFILQ